VFAYENAAVPQAIGALKHPLHYITIFVTFPQKFDKKIF
jgi:hypothetical protein